VRIWFLEDGGETRGLERCGGCGEDGGFGGWHEVLSRCGMLSG